MLEDMRLEGMPMDVLDPRFVEAIKATWLDGNKTKDIEVKTPKRCKWWNRGFCHERRMFLRSPKGMSGSPQWWLHQRRLQFLEAQKTV